MVEAGNLTIRATADTTQLDNSINRINNNLDGMSDKSTSTFGNMSRLDTVSKGLAKTLIGVGIAGSTALVGLGLKSPMVAGEMARLKTTSIELGMTMGNIIQPILEKFNDGLTGMSNMLNNNEGIINHFVGVVLSGFESSLNGVKRAWDVLSNTVTDITATLGIDIELGEMAKTILEKTGWEIFAGLLAYGVKRTPLGFLTGFATAGVTKRLAGTTDEEGNKSSVGSDIGSSVGFLGGAYAGMKTVAMLGSFLGPKGAIVGGGLGLIGGGIMGSSVGSWIGDKISNFINTSKEEDSKREAIMLTADVY